MRIVLGRPLQQPISDMEMITVTWHTCGEDKHWCSLKKLGLPLKNEIEGVYVIWVEGDPEEAVYVGQGDVSDRLASHQADTKILKYAKQGVLRVSWADVAESERDGVERYLADVLDPKVGKRHPDADPIQVNLPGPLS